MFQILAKHLDRTIFCLLGPVSYTHLMHAVCSYVPEQTNTEFSSLPPTFCGKPERRRQEK